MAGEQTPGAGSTTSYQLPSYYTDTAAGVAGGVQGMLGDTGYLNTVMNNWYGSQPGQGAGQGALGQFTQFDPNQQQQFMNPYLEGAANETMRLANQNLLENVLPQVNSTFTGAGQFGSTRNADFINRAIRDNQTGLSGALATMFKNAQDSAQNQYKDWTQMGTNASQQDFTNWLQQAQFPTQQLGALGQVTANIRPGQASSVSTESAGLTDMQKIQAAIAALNTGASDGSLQSILSMLGMDTQAPA